MSKKPVTVCLCFALLSLPLLPWAASAESADKLIRADQAVRKKLTKVLISGTLGEAMEKVEKLAGVKVVVSWRVLAACGVRQSQAIQVKAPKATVGQVLDLILGRASEKASPLAWYADEDAIYVTSQRQAMHRRLRSSPTVPPSVPTKAVAARPTPKPGIDAPGPIPSAGLNFDDVPLKDVIEYFRQRSGVSFHVNWRALAVAGIDRETAVNLKVRNISLRRTLDLLTDQLSATRDRETSVYWLVDRGVLTITTGASLDTGLRSRVIDVADLLLVVPNFRGPRLSFENMDQGQSGSGNNTLGGGGRGEGGLFDDDEGRGGGGRGGEGDRMEEDMREMRERVRTTLVEIIKESIGAEMWRDGGGKGNVRLLNDKLIISQTKLGFLLLDKAGILR